MRTVVSVAGAAILLTTFAIRVPAQVCPDVTGCWSGSYSGDVSGTIHLAFEQTGSQLEGAQRLLDDTIGSVSGSFVGSADCASLQFTTTLDNVSVEIDSSAEVTGSCMAGTFFVPLFNFNATWQACKAQCCGNGLVQSGEACDDGNLSAGDGCSATCTIEPGFTCNDERRSICSPIVCGNTILQPGEQCDDGNAITGDCCRPDCTFDPAGTPCPAPFPAVCNGNGICVGVGIPTLSELGVVALSLLMLGAVLHDRRRGMAPDRR